MGIHGALVAGTILDAVAVPFVSGGWLGSTAVVIASILAISAVQVCTDLRSGLAAVGAALVAVAEVVWLPKGVDILFVALVVVWVLLPPPKALSAILPVRLRDLLPAVILGALTAGAAMYRPPLGLRAVVLVVAATAALAATAWRLLRTRRHR
jgi:hypothetical protein